MDTVALQSELTAGHPGTGAYHADDALAAAELNAVNRTRINPIASSELLAWSAGASAGDRPRVIKIREAAASHVSEAIQGLAIAADLILQRDGTTIDLKLPDRVAMVDALVAGSVLSDGDKTSLYAVAIEDISRATEMGLGTVEAKHVRWARSL